MCLTKCHFICWSYGCLRWFSLRRRPQPSTCNRVCFTVEFDGQWIITNTSTIYASSHAIYILSHRCSTSHQWLQMVAPNINMKQTSRCSPCTESCKRRKPSVWIWRCILLSLIVYRLIFQRLESIASMLLVKGASFKWRMLGCFWRKCHFF